MNKYFLPSIVFCTLALCSVSCKTTQNVKSNANTETTANHETTDDTPLFNPEGKWLIVEVGGKTVAGEEAAEITFDPKQQLVYGNDGCNIFNGVYHVGKGNSLELTNLLSTLRACEGGSAMEIQSALNDVLFFSIDGNELTFRNEKKNVILKAVKQTADELNGRWRVSSLTGFETLAVQPSLVIDVPESKVHGNGGCNIINGSIVLDKLRTDGIRFTGMISTRMMCPEIEIESAFLKALQEIDSYRRIDDEHIGFYISNGEEPKSFPIVLEKVK